ncbi:MAG: hypothetical protein K0U78_01865 [Actinomycetia bacterium]|nr:hypothetical protein [Actinomycetes bacterium]
MAEESSAVTLSVPPPALVRAVNPLLRVLLRIPVMGAAGKEFMVVRLKGRKTGQQYAIPVSAHWIDNDLYALSNALWKHNFRDGTAAEVLHGGRRTTMHGELIQDRSVVADLYRRSAEFYGVKKAQRMMGLKFRDQQTPSLKEFTEAVDQLHLAAIRFTPAG